MHHLMALCTCVAALWPTMAQASPKVLVIDSGAHTSIAGPGAPRHIIGLPRSSHAILMDTSIRKYGLQYVVAHDEKRPGVAIPGEGYIGMTRPSNQNWYAGGFFDLQINGKTIGVTPIYSLTGRSSGNRGSVDFVFDTPQSVVRIRFVTLAGGDALYCQALLEPKVEIESLHVFLRCYPSAYVSDADRHVRTPRRDISQGKQADLDLVRESWLLYYDCIFDAGHVSPSRTGVGPCAVLWPGNQADKVSFTVGAYGTSTAMDLKPQRRDFRFVFFDYAGKKNETAIADLRLRAPALLEKLASFTFTDQSIANWPLEKRNREIAKTLATMPDEREAAAQYRKWSAELARQLELVRTGAPGAIMAEAAVALIIRQWEQGLPALKLKALLKKI